MLQDGDAALRSGQPDQALQIYEQALQQEPGNHLIQLRRAAVYQATKQWDLMIEACDQAIALKPDFGASYAIRAAAHGDKGLHARALQDFTKAIELDPNNWDPYIGKGQTFKRMDSLEQAADMFRQAAGVAARASQGQMVTACLTEQARLLRVLGKDEEAQKVEQELQSLTSRPAGGCGKKAAAILLLLASSLFSLVVTLIF
jgi:tetratricopeptide (TPR) repeat protein